MPGSQQLCKSPRTEEGESRRLIVIHHFWQFHLSVATYLTEDPEQMEREQQSVFL